MPGSLRLVLGVALTLFLTFLNYRGIRLSANFQKGMTSVVLLMFLVLVGMSTARGTPANLHPLFHGTPLVSILLTLQIVPYFLTGFESIPKYAEEANPDLRGKTYMTAIAMALGIGVSFYALSLFAVSYIAPWQSLLGKRFATAIAFEHGLGAHWPVQLIFTMAMFGLFQPYDDEGFHLLTVGAYVSGRALYTQLMTYHGPFFYEVMGGFFKLTGIAVTNGSGNARAGAGLQRGNELP